MRCEGQLFLPLSPQFLHVVQNQFRCFLFMWVSLTETIGQGGKKTPKNREPEVMARELRQWTI